MCVMTTNLLKLYCGLLYFSYLMDFVFSSVFQHNKLQLSTNSPSFDCHGMISAANAAMPATLLSSLTLILFIDVCCKLSLCIKTIVFKFLFQNVVFSCERYVLFPLNYQCSLLTASYGADYVQQTGPLAGHFNLNLAPIQTEDC